MPKDTQIAAIAIEVLIVVMLWAVSRHPQPECTMSDDADDTPEAPPPSRFVWEEGDVQIIRPGEPGYSEPGDIPPGEDDPEGAFDDEEDDENGE